MPSYRIREQRRRFLVRSFSVSVLSFSAALAATLCLTDNAFQGYFGTSKNISSQKQNENSPKVALKELSSLFNSALPDAFAFSTDSGSAEDAERESESRAATHLPK